MSPKFEMWGPTYSSGITVGLRSSLRLPDPAFRMAEQNEFGEGNARMAELTTMRMEFDFMGCLKSPKNWVKMQGMENEFI